METTNIGITAAVAAAVEGAPARAASCYQHALVAGTEAWSGSTLRGKAAKFSGRYARSRYALVGRINARLPDGWRADSALVPRVVVSAMGQRMQRRLVLTGPDGQGWDWITELRLPSAAVTS